MGKKTYIPLMKSGRNYKLFTDDISRVHSRSSKVSRPPVPAYGAMDSPTAKFETLTDVEFEPLLLG